VNAASQLQSIVESSEKALHAVSSWFGLLFLYIIIMKILLHELNKKAGSETLFTTLPD
jgi:hypothetical protein